METVQSFLDACGIPYRRNIIFKNSQKLDMCEIDFIIPYAVIEVKHSAHGINIPYTIGQIKRYFNVIPPTFVMYMYVEQNYLKLNDICKHIPLEYLNRFTLIYDIHQIKLPSIDYYTFDPSVIRSFGTFDSDKIYKKYITKNIYVPSDVYWRAVAMCDESELTRVIKFNIKFIANIPPLFAVLYGNNKINRKYIPNGFTSEYEIVFNIFNEKIKLYPINNNAPIRLIDGITAVCNRCSTIYYIDSNCKCLSGTDMKQYPTKKFLCGAVSNNYLRLCELNKIMCPVEIEILYKS